MPMKSFSTLIYFVNNFQTGPDNPEEESLNLTLAGMGGEIGPSEQTIENIMSFARSYEVFETGETGYVEMNLN
jgi:hypothetical protein